MPSVAHTANKSWSTEQSIANSRNDHQILLRPFAQRASAIVAFVIDSTVNQFDLIDFLVDREKIAEKSY